MNSYIYLAKYPVMLSEPGDGAYVLLSFWILLHFTNTADFYITSIPEPPSPHCPPDVSRITAPVQKLRGVLESAVESRCGPEAAYF
jgi:hypothetical protein